MLNLQVYKILVTDKKTSIARLGMARFKGEKAALDHLDILAELAATNRTHKHFYDYDYEVVPHYNTPRKPKKKR